MALTAAVVIVACRIIFICLPNTRLFSALITVIRLFDKERRKNKNVQQKLARNSLRSSVIQLNSYLLFYISLNKYFRSRNLLLSFNIRGVSVCSNVDRTNDEIMCTIHKHKRCVSVLLCLITANYAKKNETRKPVRKHYVVVAAAAAYSQFFDSLCFATNTCCLTY